MDIKKTKDVFQAIVAFIDDLWDVYGTSKKATPLTLYHRLTDHIKYKDVKSMQKAVSGFQKFFTRYEKYILDNELDQIPRETVISYGNSTSVHLQIQKFIYLADTDTRDAIRRHLLTISSVLEPNKEKIAELEKNIEGLDIDTSTIEGEFLGDIMSRAKDAMEGLETDNPTTAIMGLLQSGLIGDVMNGLQSGIETGDMDMNKLLGTMQGAIGAMIPQAEETGPKIEELEE